jgi:hypothetical protein
MPLNFAYFLSGLWSELSRFRDSRNDEEPSVLRIGSRGDCVNESV